MSNKPMLNIHERLDKAANEYLECRQAFEVAEAELKRCESVVDEILSRIRREITEVQHGDNLPLVTGNKKRREISVEQM